MSGDASPLMAEHNNFLYVVTRNQQMKIDANTGSVIWEVNNSYTGDIAKYIGDPTYRPMVLTDDTLWFINNVSSGGDHLIGMRTSNGQVFADVNVQSLVNTGAGETVIGVQDMVAANGKLGLLLDVRLAGDTNVNVSGNGVKYQDLVVFSMQPLPAVPADPSGLIATPFSASQIDLSWTDNSSNETGFSIDETTDSTFATGVSTYTVGADVTTYNATGLAGSTTYYYRVRAYNIGGSSADSNTASATTLADVPTAPSVLSATAVSQTQISLSWTDNANNEDGFYIDEATDGGFTQNVVTSTVAADVTALNVTGLSANTTYYFRVRAFNVIGASTDSNTASATTLDYVPAAPSGLRATAVSFSQIDVSWTDNSSNEVGFYLDRAADGGFGSGLVTSTVGANTTSFSATGLSALTTYYFRVRAYNSGGPSGNSATASAMTLDTPPAAPSGLQASALSQTQIHLSWTDASSNESGFYLDRAGDSGFSSGLVTATVAANTTSFDATGLTSASSYYFRVRAYNAGGASANSATASATTLPDAPLCSLEPRGQRQLLDPDHPHLDGCLQQ